MNSHRVNKYRLSEKAFFNTYKLQPEEQFIKVKKLAINIRVQTVGKGQPLLFIHGGPSAGGMWAQLTSLLPQYQCIILDRPGCGLSEAISYKNLTRERLTDIFVSVIDEILFYFNIEKLPIAGSSFGGYLAMLYALQKPEKISRLVLEGCPANVEKMKVPAFMKMMLLPGFHWLVPKLPSTKSVLKNIMKGLGHSYSVKQQIISEPFIDWYVSLFNDTNTMKNDLSMICKTIPHGKINPEFTLHDHEIEKIHQPTLWLWGKDDPFGGIVLGERIHSRMKNSTFVAFDNSGHLPWIDQPEKHTNKITEHLTS